MTDSTPQVLIVGAGPTGLALAIDLRHHGIPFRIIDAAEAPTTLSKAVTLMPRTLEAFQMRGFAGETIAAGEKIASFSVYSQSRMLFHTDYRNVTSEFRFLLNISQAETERILHGQLAKRGGVVEWKTRLVSLEQDEREVRAVIETAAGVHETVRVAYLAGCDGAHSVTRHQLGFDFQGDSYQDTWMLADVTLRWAFPPGNGYSFFGDDGLLAVFPLPGGRHRLYVVQPKSHALGHAPSLEEFRETVDRLVPGLCEIRDPGWLAEFHCHHRKVRSYRKGRVFLAGDAAHIHSPETGLGMNTGLQDSFNLAWKLAAVLKGVCTPELLETYHAERSFVGEQVVKLSDFTHRLATPFGWLGEHVREPLWRFFHGLYAHHYSLVEAGLQTQIEYPHNDFLRVVGSPDEVRDLAVHQHAGRRCYDLPLFDPASGQQVRLYDVIDPAKFTLLVFTGRQLRTPELNAEIESLAVRLGALADVWLVEGSPMAGASPAGVRHFLDAPLFAHYLAGAQNGAIFLLRPDAYLAFTGFGFPWPELHAFLVHVFPRADLPAGVR